MPEPVPTRREGSPGGPAATRREGVPTSGWVALDLNALPDALRVRLSDPTPMRTSGGEAQLFRVHDSDHPDERVLKIYFPHIELDRNVWSQISSLRSKHVVDLIETGELADGRFFELMEYLPKGSLRDVGAGRHTFDSPSIGQMVDQLTKGLDALHGMGITHRDLKPENVLVRGGNPVELVLTDFGLSRRLEASAHFTTAARTSAYAAPEAWAGEVSHARDWWSLGIMVLELAAGQQPFSGLDDRVIQSTVTTKPVPVDAINDRRIASLCAGLLVSDPRKRWGSDQVHRWLGGESPPVPDRRVPIEATAFEFDGLRYYEPESLAAAMARSWRLAARRYGIAPSPSWAALTDWLKQFNDPHRYPEGVVERRLDLLNELETSTEVPNIKLLRLLAGLNPKQPPIYRQAHIDAAKLRELARRAQDGPQADPQTVQDHEIIGELWEGKLLGVLAAFDDGGASELAAIGKRWEASVGRLNQSVAELERNPRITGTWRRDRHRPAALASLLEAAAGAPREGDWVRALAGRAAALPVRVSWFDGVLRWAGTNPLRCYAALPAAGVAAAEAQQVVMARQAAEQARLAREQAWARHEHGRLSLQGRATGTAVGGAAVLAGLWVLVLLVAAHVPALALAVLCVIAVHLIIEIAVARTLAGDYHPRYSLLQWIQTAAGNLGSRMRWAPGRWALGIIGTLVLLGFVPLLVPVAAIGAAVAHAASATTRHRRWSQAHDHYRQQVLNP